MKIKDLSLLFLEPKKSIRKKIYTILSNKIKSVLFANNIQEVIKMDKKYSPNAIAINRDTENILEASMLNIVKDLKIEKPIITYNMHQKDVVFLAQNEKNISNSSITKELFCTLKQAFVEAKEVIVLNRSKIHIDKLENFDLLTGLYSYDKICNILTENTSKKDGFGKYFTLIIVSIDEYLAIKNTFGINFSENILLETSKIVSQNTRIDDIVGMWKNGEIVVISPKINKKRALTIAENLRKSIEEYSFKRIGRQITASIGVIQCRENEHLKNITERADIAIYKAKKGGKNRVCG